MSGTGRTPPCSSPITPYGNAADSGACGTAQRHAGAPAAGPPPGGGLSEGAPNDSGLRHAMTATSRSERRPSSSITGRPSRADEGGGPHAGADSRHNEYSTKTDKSLSLSPSRAASLNPLGLRNPLLACPHSRP